MKEGDEPSEEDVKVPLSTLVLNKRTAVKIRDMADYGDVFYAIENTVLLVWEEDRRMRDRDVLFAYTSLLKDFDCQPDDSLASEIAKSVKAILLLRKQNKQKDYSYGEITSCLSMLVSIAKEHSSPDGVGYLKWVTAFLSGKMPTNINNILEYIFKNEL
jgi:hypothetical protein